MIVTGAVGTIQGVATAGSVGTLARAIYDRVIARDTSRTVIVQAHEYAADRSNQIAEGVAGYLNANQIAAAPVSDLTALAALSTSGLSDGSSVYVNSVEDWYVLETASSHTADGLCVIDAAGTGTGYWVARHAGRWDDVQGNVAQGTGVAALTQDSWRGTAAQLWFFRHDQQDALTFVYQMPHRWKRNTAVHPHMHCIPAADPVGATETVLIDGYYAWSEVGVVLPDLASWVPFSVQMTVTQTTDVYKQKIVALVPAGITPPLNAKESSCLIVYVRRNSASATDSYTTPKAWGTGTANLALIHFDVHYQSDKLGTETEIPA